MANDFDLNDLLNMAENEELEVVSADEDELAPTDAPFDSDESGDPESPEKPKREPKPEVLRVELVKKEFTVQDAHDRREALQLTEEEIASGEWVKLADVDKLCKENGIPISRFVRAFGGDRALLPPINDNWITRYVGRVRYLPAYCLSDEAMDELRALAPAPRERKPKAEGADEAEGPAVWTAASLKKKNRAELEGFGISMGLPFNEQKLTKPQMIDMILAAQGEGDSEDESEE